MATRQRAKKEKVFKIDAPMAEALTALVREDLTAQGKGAALAQHVLRMLESTTLSLEAEQVKLIREHVNMEIVRQRPAWASPAGDTPVIKADRKRRAAKVRTTATRIMSALRAALGDLGITMPQPERVGGRKASTDKGRDGRTPRSEAAKAADAVVVSAGDAGAAISALRRMIEEALKAGDYITVIAAAERAIKVQDVE